MATGRSGIDRQLSQPWFSMKGMNQTAGSAFAPLRREIQGIGQWLIDAEGAELGEGLIGIRESITQLEAIFAEGLRRFDRAGEYRAEGALSAVRLAEVEVQAFRRCGC